jgi:endoglucanase
MPRFWFWNEPNPEPLVANYLEDTQLAQPGSVVEMTTYSLVHGACRPSDSPSFVQRFHDWIDKLAEGIGNYRVILYFEEDALITVGRTCPTPHGVHVRMVNELNWAVHRLEHDPHLVVYLDGGAADAMPWPRTAQLLDEAGVHDAQGSFLNSTHFDWTTSELHYGQQIAKELGGVHFVVNTGANGRGPLLSKDPVHQGIEQLCNPLGRGLGPLTTHTGYKWADAFAWFSTPGLSGGNGPGCPAGSPPTAQYWAKYAVMLVRNWVNRVTGPHYPLIRQR